MGSVRGALRLPSKCPGRVNHHEMILLFIYFSLEFPAHKIMIISPRCLPPRQVYDVPPLHMLPEAIASDVLAFLTAKVQSFLE